MSKIPSLEEMLKMYTKKSLCERIQQHIQTIDQLEKQLAEKDEEIELKEHVIQSIEKQRDKAYDDYGYLSKIERELALQNYDYEKQIALLKSSEKCLTERIKKQTELVIQELEKLRDKVIEKSEKIVDTVDYIQDFHSGITIGRLKRIIDQQIKELKNNKKD